MNKKFICGVLVCLGLLFSSMGIAFAEGVGILLFEDTEYRAELDTQDVKWVGSLKETIQVSSLPRSQGQGGALWQLEKGTVVYITERTESRIIVFHCSNPAIEFETLESNITYGFPESAQRYLPVQVSRPDALEPEESGREYKITWYCEECNTPRGSRAVALAGSQAEVGTCATNEFPLGSWIEVEGYGQFYVNDRCGRDGVIDLFRESASPGVCDCSGTGRARAWIV
jgi:3D (Asp-Asp-Asp) domain-containing protein